MVTLEKSSPIYRLVDSIVESLSPEKIILFGSYATGQADKERDVDLLIVADSDQDRLERTWQAYRLLRGKRETPLDIIVLTPQEYEDMKKGGYPLIREVEEEGSVLYERRC